LITSGTSVPLLTKIRSQESSGQLGEV